jgi:hypothetical protein
MTAINLDADYSDTASDDYSNTPTNDFLQRVADNSCNIIYNCDVVPHGVGDLGFMNDVLEDVIPDLAKEVASDGWFHRTKQYYMTKFLKSLYNGFDNNEEQGEMAVPFSVLAAYHHVGNVIYYHSATAEPVRLRDSSFHPDSVEEFRKYEVARPRDNKNVGAIEQLTDAHLFFPKALSYNLAKSE